MIADKAAAIAIDAAMKFRAAIALYADEGLHQPAEQARQLELALHGDEANTFLIAVDERSVAVVIVGIVAISRAIAPAFMDKGPRQNAGQLGAGVGVLRNLHAGRGFQHEYARAAAWRDFDDAMMQPRRDPAPRPEFVTEQCIAFRLPDRHRGVLALAGARRIRLVIQNA